MSGRRAQREAAKQRRLQLEREAQRRRERFARLRVAGWVGLVAVVAAVTAVAASGGHSSPAQAPTAGAALLASTGGAASGPTVDGIQCQTSEQVLFHIHAHLAVFVSGRQRIVPAGIGIAPPRHEQETVDGPFVSGGSCFYWLHSHTDDGVIHIESPIQRKYTLGDYFDVWNEPLGADQVGPARGAVTAYLNGKRFTGNPRSIPLAAHGVIQLDVGTRVRPLRYVFAPGL